VGFVLELLLSLLFASIRPIACYLAIRTAFQIQGEALLFSYLSYLRQSVSSVFFHIFKLYDFNLYIALKN
jgi:hypothetical protein